MVKVVVLQLSVGEGNTGVGGDVTINAGITSASDNIGIPITIGSGKGKYSNIKWCCIDINI